MILHLYNVKNSSVNPDSYTWWPPTNACVVSANVGTGAVGATRAAGERHVDGVKAEAITRMSMKEVLRRGHRYHKSAKSTYAFCAAHDHRFHRGSDHRFPCLFLIISCCALPSNRGTSLA